MLRKPTKKFIILASHETMLGAISNFLNLEKVGYVFIDNSVTLEELRYSVDKFQMDKNCWVALLSINAASAVNTLTAAEIVIFAELHWDLEVYFFY